MNPSIEKLAMGAGNSAYDEPEFRNIIEDHLTWLMNHGGTTSISVSPKQIDVYAFDWIGLLNNLNIPSDYHWVVIRMNEGMSFTDVPPLLRNLLVPDFQLVNNLYVLNKSTKRIR